MRRRGAIADPGIGESCDQIERRSVFGGRESLGGDCGQNFPALNGLDGGDELGGAGARTGVGQRGHFSFELREEAGPGDRAGPGGSSVARGIVDAFEFPSEDAAEQAVRPRELINKTGADEGRQRRVEDVSFPAEPRGNGSVRRASTIPGHD
ncbi:MAG: hypothetical protein DCC66_06905 [Planctomycetota bacterium]|nr:MAG: hypothetical protein DCC66_06905 [Planctomycetota bacterium]